MTLNALLGRLLDNGTELELRSGLNFRNGLYPRGNNTTNRNDVYNEYAGRVVVVSSVARITSLESALDAAVSLSPAADNPLVVVVADSGVYTAGGLSIPAYCTVHAPFAKITGTGSASTPMFTLAGAESALHAGWLVPQSGQGAVLAADVAGTKRLVADRIDVAGSGGYAAVDVSTSGATLLYRVQTTHVGEAATGAGDLSVSSGHIHVKGGDFYLDGDGAVAIARIGSGSTLVNVDRIIDTGFASTVGFNASAGTITGYVCEIDVDDDITGAGTTTILLPDGTNLT
jgi:hypothetical protein